MAINHVASSHYIIITLATNILKSYYASFQEVATNSNNQIMRAFSYTNNITYTLMSLSDLWSELL